MNPKFDSDLAGVVVLACLIRVLVPPALSWLGGAIESGAARLVVLCRRLDGLPGLPYEKRCPKCGYSEATHERPVSARI